MGLYLCVFDDGGEEVDGVEVGSYADFNFLRNTVIDLVESGCFATRCPVLVSYSDCDGQWSPEEASLLVAELDLIQTAFANAPAIALNADWKEDVARTTGIDPKSLLDCFFDVDGEPLVQRLRGLATLSVQTNAAILFQ